MLGGGDQLARGARKAQFAAGKSKRGDKIQINPGTIGTEKDAADSVRDKKALQALVASDPTLAAPKLKSKLTPLYDRVIVRKSAEETRSRGGIIIPEEAKDRPSEGIVLYVGFGRLVDGEIKPLYLKGGEKVLFGKYAGTEVKVDGEVVLMMREDEVLAVISEENV